MPPPKDLLGKPAERGSITQAADAQQQRIADISNVAKTVNTMKKDVDQKIKETQFEMGESDNIERVQSSMNKVLQKLSDTIGAMATGVKNITIDTAAATKDAIAQYGKAVSEDISVNKQNIVAMALSRTTPLFGYFAAKFMETDVFRKAATKMREGFGNVIGGITNLFRKGAKGVGERLRGAGREGGPPAAPPKMQHGGFVERGGMAQLHPAEVVMPIDDVLKRVDEQVGVAKQFMQIARLQQLKALGRMNVFVADSQKKARVGLVKGFMRAWSEVATQYMEPTDKRMLRALLAIQDALGAQIGTMRQVWTKMLIEHPFFRNLLFSFRALTGLVKFPAKLVYKFFKARGGYRAQISRARNPMMATAEHTGLIYAEGMWRLDNIALFTRATAEAVRDLSSFITGKRYKRLEGVATGFWRLSSIFTKPFMLAFKGISKSSEWAIKKALVGTKYESLADFLTKERKGVTLGKRRRMVKDIYGAGGFSSKAIQEKNKKQINFFDRMKTYVVQENKQRSIENKRGKVIVTQAKAQTKSLTRLRKRLRMGGIMRFIMMAGSMIMSLAGKLLTGAGGFLTTIGKMALGGLTSALPFLGSAKGLARFLGPVGAVIGAGAMGYGLGTAIERSLIAPLRKKHFAEMDRLKEEARKKTEPSRKEAAELRRKSRTRLGRATMTGEEKRKMQILSKTRMDIAGRGELRKLKGRQIGAWGRWHLQAIKDSQEAFIAENINEYMDYSPVEISALRGKWLREGGFRGKIIGENPIKYGKIREAAFLAYLKKTGTKVNIEEGAIDALYGAGGKAKEISAAAYEKTKLAYGAAKGEMLKLYGQTKVMGEILDKAGEKLVTGSENVVTSVNNMSNSVVNQISNTTANTMTGSKNLYRKGDHFLQQIVDGDMD